MNLRKDHYRLAHGWPSGSVRRTHTFARPCKGPKASVNSVLAAAERPGTRGTARPLPLRCSQRWRSWGRPARLWPLPLLCSQGTLGDSVMPAYRGAPRGHARLWVYSSAGLGPRAASVPGRNPETKAPPPGWGRPTGTQPASLLRRERGGFNVPGAALLAAWRPRGARGLCRPSFSPFRNLEDPGRCL